MKRLISKAKDHGKKIIVHLKRHHRKYLLGILVGLCITLGSVSFFSGLKADNLNNLHHSNEFVEGFIYAYNNGLIEVDDINEIDIDKVLYDNVLKIEMADIVARYAINLLGHSIEVDDNEAHDNNVHIGEVSTDRPCGENDVPEALDNQYNNGYSNLLDLGIVNCGNFNPYSSGNIADFGTRLSRALNLDDPKTLDQLNNSDPYYSLHLKRLQEEGILDEIPDPNEPITNGYIFVYLMRADKNYKSLAGCSAGELLGCTDAENYEICTTKCSIPRCEVEYSTTGLTNKDVIAYLTGCSEEITGTDLQYVFTENGTYNFEFQDLVGNTGEATANVNWITDLTFTLNDNFVSEVNKPHGRASLYSDITIFDGVFHSNKQLNLQSLSRGINFAVNGFKPNVRISSYFGAYAQFGGCTAGLSLTGVTDASGNAEVSMDLSNVLSTSCPIRSGNTVLKIIVNKRGLLPLNSSFNAENLYINKIVYKNENNENKIIDFSGIISGTNINFVLDTGELTDFSGVSISLQQSDNYAPEIIKKPGDLYFPIFSGNFVSNAKLHTKNISGGFNLYIEGFEPNTAVNSLISTYADFGGCTAGLSLTGVTDGSGNADITVKFSDIRQNSFFGSCYMNSGDTVFKIVFNGYHSNLGNTKILARNLYIDDYIFTDDNGDDHTINVNGSISGSTVVFTNPPLCGVTYNISRPTSKDVIAYLTGCNKEITGTNLQHIFTGNGSYTFEFQDLYGNTGSKNAEVTWITSISYDSDANITYTDTEGNVFTGIGTIAITNGTSTIVMLDRNLGATTNDINSTGSYGYHFQWGNNHGFTSCYTSGCYVFPNGEDIGTTRVTTANSYGPNRSRYVGSTFILTRGEPYDWANPSNDNLWGGSGDNADNNRGYPVTNPTNRQGPCPDGYHVPSYGEFLKIKDMMDVGDIHSKLLIPFAGTRSMLNAEVNGLGDFIYGFLWSSTPHASDYHEARSISVYTGQFGLTANARSYGFSVRCFKNSGDNTTGNVHSSTGLIDYFKIRVPEYITVEETTDFTIKAIKNGEVLRSYSGTIFLGLRDEKGKLVSDSSYRIVNDGIYNFKASDLGSKTFKNGLKVNKAGTYTLEVEDRSGGYKGSTTVIVTGYSKLIEYDTLKFNPNYSDEENEAYQYAHHYGITTKNNIKDAEMHNGLNRIAMAKMLSQYAINALGIRDFDTNRNCTFTDVPSSLDEKYDYGVTKACQLGIMGVNMPNNKFYPNGYVSRAEFATALSRLLYNTKDGTDKYYSTHITKLYNEGIITNTDPTLRELRGYVMLMLKRAGEDYND